MYLAAYLVFAGASQKTFFWNYQNHRLEFSRFVPSEVNFTGLINSSRKLPEDYLNYSTRGQN